MLNTYRDRGIIKWAAFDALNGFNSMLKEMKHRLGMIAKPILSDDDFETMNTTIKEAIRNNTEISITYFENGYSKNSFGKIKKIDYNNRVIILSTREAISAFDILEIEMI